MALSPKTKWSTSCPGHRHQYGNDVVYRVRCLKRDAPEINAALARGEYESARAACIAAGIIAVPHPDDRRLFALMDAWSKADLVDRQMFLAVLDEEIEAAQEGRLLRQLAPPRRAAAPWKPADGVNLPAVEALVEQHGVTGAARELGVTARTVRRWRAGTTRPRTATAKSNSKNDRT